MGSGVGVATVGTGMGLASVGNGIGVAVGIGAGEGLALGVDVVCALTEPLAGPDTVIASTAAMTAESPSKLLV